LDKDTVVVQQSTTTEAAAGNGSFADTALQPLSTPLMARDPKTIFLQIAGYESEPVAVSISPEDTAFIILKKCGLDGCFLMRDAEPHSYYNDSDTPYPGITDGQQLFALLPGDE
jgi:hypothetical protein